MQHANTLHKNMTVLTTLCKFIVDFRSFFKVPLFVLNNTDYIHYQNQNIAWKLAKPDLLISELSTEFLESKVPVTNVNSQF